MNSGYSNVFDAVTVRQLFCFYLVFFVFKVEQTWEKFEPLQHLPLLAEIHHQVTHVVAGFRLQGEAKGWSHCYTADKEGETHTEREKKKHTQSGNKQLSIIQLDRKKENR